MNPTVESKSIKTRQKFYKLLPYDGFCILKPADFKEMLKIIHNEPDDMAKHYYFSLVLDRCFASGWGWYMRLGQSLSRISTIDHASQLSPQKQADGLAVLKMIKGMHIELKYKPNYIALINTFIHEFGGTSQNKEKNAQQNTTKFNRAITALVMGDKLPRKIKKQVKKQIQR